MGLAKGNTYGDKGSNFNFQLRELQLLSFLVASSATIAGAVHDEDSIHTSGDKGIFALAVRHDADTPMAAEGYYSPIQTNARGEVKVAMDADIEIGQVELKDGTTTNQGVIKAGNTFAVADMALGVADKNVLDAITSSSVATPTSLAFITNAAVNAGATQISGTSHPCKWVIITAALANGNSVTVGGAGVVSDQGMILQPGFSTPPIPLSNSNLVYAIGPDAGPYTVSVQYLN